MYPQATASSWDPGQLSNYACHGRFDWCDLVVLADRYLMIGHGRLSENIGWPECYMIFAESPNSANIYMAEISPLV
jgi:hypothetical protein